MLVFAAFTQYSYAQSAAKADSVKSKQNLVKMNVLALPLKTFSVQYERLLTRKISVGLGFSTMPKSGIPFKGTFKSLIDDEDTKEQIENLKTSNLTITPEVRFYLGKGNYQGFYIAPYARYTHFTAAVPYNYDDENGDKQTINLDGKINAFSGGILFGAQWKLSKIVYLDWWILGGAYGTSKGDLVGNKSLTPQEQQYLKESLDDIDLPLVKTSYEVNDNGAKLHIDGPWANLRAGLSVGIRF
ncbi:DUF3575 domain-containing protein [Pedobacter sp. BS3]|nr:DUF3575 domain-containing protein [Pedobacter sp. BS3]